MAERRRLSPEERQRLQDRWRARTASPAPQAPTPPRFTVPKPQSTTLAGGRDAPKMPRRQGSAPVSSRPMIVLGAMLLAGLTILAFAGGRLFGSASGDGVSSSEQRQLVASGFPTPSGSPEAFAVGVPSVPTATILDGQRAPVVCLDPGHGGPDSGFTQFWNELGFTLVEKNLVLEHAWDLEARLKQHGYTVVMTRRTDVAVNATGADVNGDGKTMADDQPTINEHGNRNLDELQARINICNEGDADLLVSMHVNGFSSSIPHGYETWYTAEREFGEQNRQFAYQAYDALKRKLAEIGYVVDPSVERGANPDTSSSVQTPNSRYKHFVILGPAAPGEIVASEMPGAIVEALFVSNDGDAAVLASPSGRNAIVNAYEEAIVQYFAENPPG
jgi:N-acetylmuramoyl-L-alanine amidase